MEWYLGDPGLPGDRLTLIVSHFSWAILSDAASERSLQDEFNQAEWMLDYRFRFGNI